jgi:hypothetical protein
LTGTLPNSLGNLTYLTYVDFEEGELSGTIPASLTILPYLEHLALAENYFSGQLPTEWTPSIRQLDIHSNLLSGSIPSVLFDYLQYLYVNICVIVGDQNACSAVAVSRILIPPQFAEM